MANRYTTGKASASNLPGGRSRNASGSGTSLHKDYEEFASLLDKPNEGDMKTVEEMKRHLYDDHFEGKPIERAMHLLSLGEEVQKLSVIRQLLQLIKADEQGCVQRVFPKIQQALNTASTEFHIETARAFTAILEQKAIPHNAYAQTFLPSILYHIDNRDPVVSNAWLETLLEVSEHLPADIVKHEILHVAINKGQISQSVWHRVASCKLLGKMCTRFDHQIVKKDILPVVHSLCQDVNEAVRACICAQLHHVARGLPPDMIKPALIPILVELGRDETVQVRVEATETIVHMIPYLNQEVLKLTIIPLVKKICEQAVIAMDDTLVMVSKQFGNLCVGLESCLTMSEKLWMVTYYHNISHLGIPSIGTKKDSYFSHNMDRINARYIECRQLCAFNFPTMAKFCNSNENLLEKLYPSFIDFSTDPYYMVRKTIGSTIYEVAGLLGPNNRVVKNEILTLLWDNMEEVLIGVVPNLGKTIEVLIGTGVLIPEQESSNVELGRGLMQCDKTIRDKTHNWRLHSEFITQLESIVKCLSSDYIYTHFVPLMFEKMHKARALPCRLAASRTLLIFLRHNLKNNQRQEIRGRIQAEFCLSPCCYKRMLFLRLCNIAREVFSRSYFKEHFFYLLLSKSEDKVANNRLLLVRQFPYLKAMIVLPSDKKYLQSLESCVRNMLATEKDRDVAAELRFSVNRLEKTDIIPEGSQMQSIEDLEDCKKMEEELKFASAGNRPMGSFTVSSDRGRGKDGKSKTNPPKTFPVITSTAGASSSSASSPLNSPGRAERNLSVASTYSTMNSRRTSPVSTDSSTSNLSNTTLNSYTNTTNSLYPLRSSMVNHETNSDHNCTCYPNFRSEYHENLNLRALIDTNLEKSKFKILDHIKQKINSDARYKISRSCKYNMEISWLNLETDLKNELYTLVNNSKVHGDRNFKEKSKFLSDFRNFNESTLSKFISDDKEYKETIYNVTGVSNYYNRFSFSLFEDKVNFFERKIKLDDAKNNTDFTDCSCFDLTNNQNKYFESDENKKISYFSKNFEEDFYRDAGVKANEIMGRKFSGIPIHDKPQVSSPKISTSVTNKRRTWFGNENINTKSLDLDSLCKYSPREKDKSYQRKKSETLPLRESISLEKIGIGPRSKSFILPSTLIYSDKQVTNYQSTKLIFDKQVDDMLKSDGLNDSVESPEGKDYFNNQGAIRKFRTEPDANRFGFRPRSREKSPKIDSKNEKFFPKTKIPVGRASSNSSPNSSRSSSPNLGLTKEKSENELKLQTNGTKKIPSVVSRKSLMIQTNSLKNDIKNNRRSLDSTKISISSLDKTPNNVKRKNDKPSIDKLKTVGNAHLENTISNTSGGGEDKNNVETVANSNSSRLPVRRGRPEK